MNLANHFWRDLGRAALALPVVALPAGCDCYGAVCGNCPPALVLRVTDSNSGAPVTDVTVAGANAECDVLQEYGYTECRLSLGTGAYDVTVAAPGYHNAKLSGTIDPDSGDGCCSCGYNQKRRNVALTTQ